MKKTLFVILVLLCGVTFNSFSKSTKSVSKMSSSAKKKTLELCCVTNTQVFQKTAGDGSSASVSFSATVCTGGCALSTAVAKALVNEAAAKAFEK
jgi:hypothetical protein